MRCLETCTWLRDCRIVLGEYQVSSPKSVSGLVFVIFTFANRPASDRGPLKTTM